ncbi:MAG TPA: DUF2726 domain-containing protein [Bacilli bacterium]|nr:DUF2726 domain-containing protein [Bacilli bacterium]
MLKRIIDFILWLFGIKDDEDVEKATTDIKYEKKPIMSDYEIMFYNRMKDLETEYNIVPQLVLSSVVDKKSKQKYRSELYRIIDFAIFSKDYSKLLLLIELNDNTHNQRKRKDRDLKVKKICNSAKIKLITFYTKYPNEKDYIINRIKKEIETNESMNKENDII